MRKALTIQDEISKQAALHPDRLAMKDKRNALSFAELDERANKLARSLVDAGLSADDKVAVLLSNRIEWGEVMLGCFKAGVVPAGVNYMFAPAQVHHAIESVGADFFLFESEFAKTVNEIESDLPISDEFLVEVDGEDGSSYRQYTEFLADSSLSFSDGRLPDDDACIWFTSGTTGQPKPLVWTQSALVNHFVIHGLSLELNEDDYSLLLMPFFHGNSQAYFMSQLYLGGSVYVHRGRGFDPEETLHIMDTEEITFTSMVPTHYNQLIYDVDIERYDLAELDTVLSSSAPLSKRLKRDIVGAVDCNVVEAYGSTEMGMPVMLRPKDQLQKIGSIGTPLPGCDVIVIDEETQEPVELGEVGEIYARMPWGMDRYYGLPEKTGEVLIDREGARWMTANDMGRFDEDGFLYMINRKDDMIITGGENVYPSHIEEVLHDHPAIKDVAVIGVPDDKWGEAVYAVAVPMADEQPTREEIRSFCRNHVADYELPQGIDYVKNLPRTSTGKVLRGEVQNKYWDGKKDYSML